MLFSKEISDGNRTLDSEHEKLHGIINQITSLIVAGEVAALPKTFELLENGLCAYFSVEEDIARALNFDFTHHQLAHQNLLNRFQRIRDELIAKNTRLSKSEEKVYIVYLRDCLIRHIKEDDKTFKAVLCSQFYDFKPN